MSVDDSYSMIINLTILECKLRRQYYCDILGIDNKSNHIGM